MGSPGSYVLVVRLSRDSLVPVGRLGRFRCGVGFYCYSGSAMGPGGLRSRVARHLREHKKPHWHIDYLLRHAVVIEIWQAPSTARLECLCMQALLGIPGAHVPIPAFGSSDCTCEAHLAYSLSLPSFAAFCGRLHDLGADAAPWERVLIRPSED